MFEKRGEVFNALSELTALSLDHLHKNAKKIMSGEYIGSGPVDEKKNEDLVKACKLIEIDNAKVMKTKWDKEQGDSIAARLPSKHSILQYFQGFVSFPVWTEESKEDGTVEEITAKIDALGSGKAKAAMLADLLFKRGRRHACEIDLVSATGDFEKAAETIGGDKEVMQQTTHYLDLVEWLGVCKHLSWDMNQASAFYSECLGAEPDNIEVIVKHAGVMMDGGNLEEAKKMFDKALEIDENSPDALLHRR